MKKLCGDIFRGPPEVDEAVCQRKMGHKGKHYDEWTQNGAARWEDGLLVDKRAKVVVTWKVVE